MGFHLFSSNKVEILKEQLASVLQANPPASPFTPEIILVPSMPMQRWLALQLADASGINCNTDFPLPAAWLWQQVSDGSEDPLNRERATWLIFDLLDSLQDHDAFHTIKAYLDDDANDIKRWQLSGRIADVFDRYQYYRPEMIRSWSKGENDGWQSMLWRALLEQIDAPHRVAVIEQFLEKLDANTAKQLPQKVSIFAVSSLPPLLLQVIQRLSQYIDVYFYYLSPTDAYWADLKSGKVIAKQELENPDEAQYYDSGHELLTSWGKQGQSFQDILLSANADVDDLPLYDQAWPATMLADLQRNIFLTRNESIEEAVVDDSLAVHICHSPLRECQVLHDELLQALQSRADLKPEDILIMVPEISRYAPYIEAVFTKDIEARPFIPWNLSDISVADEHPVIRTFLQLLTLPTSRFVRSEIESLLDVPEICSRFAIESDDIASIRTLLEALNVRWGVDEKHRAALGLAANIENSWKQAEQRLLAGFSMGEGDLWHDIAPVDIETGCIDVMARFWTLFDCLNRWRRSLHAPRSAQAWQSDLTRMLDDLFVEVGNESNRLQEIRNVLADLTEQADQSELSLPLLSQWLEEQLAQRPAASHYFSGGVSFCGMQPMRSLPFRYICLLGMQDAAFPGREHPLEFDRMVEKPRLCDPRKSETDRYLMLETLLCARDVFYISYTGRSIRDNSICQPSVLVDELLDELKNSYGKSCIEAITHVHPMQPFSDINFEKHRAFDTYWCSLANAIREEQPATIDGGIVWPNGALSMDDERQAVDWKGVELQDIELRHLLRFVKDPIKFFVNRSLKIYLNEDDQLLDDEPFSLDDLQKWQIKDRLISDFLLRGGVDTDHLKAEGMLPHGSAANLVLSQQQAAVASMFDDLVAFQSLQPVSKTVVISLTAEASNPVRIGGQVTGYYSGQGLLRVTASSLKGKHILPLWLEHLALCATEQLPAGELSRFIYTAGKEKEKREISFSHLAVSDARKYLSSYVSAYMQGLSRPLPVFQGASWAYADTLETTADKSADHIADESKAMTAAMKAWEVTWNGSGDRYDDHVQLIMRGIEGNPINDPAFVSWSHLFYQTMQDNWSKS